MIQLRTAMPTLATLSGTASVQQKTYYDASGRTVARSSTDSQGTVTTRDSSGRVITPSIKPVIGSFQGSYQFTVGR
ncbi:hypothetical protein XI07_04705 [Bradyrhizobium sp. CCBAU 11445]|nr:hypothetical protein [Bradyrhizobium sp. CCBAU 11445]